MTGMRTSDFLLWCCLLLATALPATADDISLIGDARLSGTIRSINDAGVVELSSILSPDPITLRADAVRKVQFSNPPEQERAPGALVELNNGDKLPVTVEKLDAAALTVMTTFAGRLVIPRVDLNALQLGIQKRKVVYSGPQSAEEWAGDSGGAGNWKFEDQTLVASGPAYVSKKMNIPERFSLKLMVKWQGNPNFQIYFADPLKPRGEVSDRYYFQFAGAGMELKRESATGNRFTTVILSNRTPDQFPGNKFELEIQVDRKSSRLRLIVNGEEEGIGIDPVSGLPSGKGITLVSNIANGSRLEVNHIELQELDDSRARHRSESRGDIKTDSLISRDDDRWGGHLQFIKPSKDGLVFSFKSDFQEAPLELLGNDVSTVFFEKKDDRVKEKMSSPFALKLQDHGSLHVSSCAFTGDIVNAIHPLLGPLKITRSGVVALDHLDQKIKQDSDE